MAPPLYRTSNLDSDGWGAGLGRNLTPAEVDENFFGLDQRLEAVEENPAEPVSIASISQTGNKLTVTMSDASTFGPFTLPAAAFVYTGAWEAGHNYAVYDFFTADNALYMTTTAHTADSEFDPNSGDYQLILPDAVLYDIGFFYPGQPGAGITTGRAMCQLVLNRNVYLPAALTGSIARLEVDPASTLAFDIKKNATTIGTLTFAGGSTTGVFSFAADVQFAAGDRLRIMAPTSLDADALDLTVNLAAVKGVV